MKAKYKGMPGKMGSLGVKGLGVLWIKEILEIPSFKLTHRISPMTDWIILGFSVLAGDTTNKVNIFKEESLWKGFT